MAKVKVNAPEGYHFMINKSGGFYVMKTAATGYVAHTLEDGSKSSEYINMPYETSHTSPIKSNRSSRASRTAGPTVRTTNRTVTNTGSRVTRTTSSGGSSGGGGY
tara:strand:+ start:191 stop:505 length:315 start_codon:yes stop_codon:yes gene_type:complete